MPQVNDQDETFGAWLLAQRDREGLVVQLVEGAKADRRGEPIVTGTDS